MKAIIVFDVNEFTYEAIKEWFTGDITLHMGNDGFIDFQDVILQHMPQKKADEDGTISEQKEPTECEWDFISGYNTCIDEILGEEE